MKNTQLIFVLVALIGVFGRATDSSESKSASSSRSSSSEEMNYNDRADLMKIGGDDNSTVEEVKDTETAGKTDLGKFDEAIDDDEKIYMGKRTPGNGTDSNEDDDLMLANQLNVTMEDGADKNETVLGIDTFGSQGI